MTLPHSIPATAHYDEIPHRCIKNAKSILDVGSSDGSMARSSHYGPFFDRVNDAGNYLGVDIQKFERNHYNIIQQDILDFIPEREYDLVIASHVIEHIPIERWQQLLDMLYGCVAEGGHLIINVPFREYESGHAHPCKAMRHHVFNIDKRMMERFLSKGRYFYSRGRWWYFRDEGEFLPYAVLRFIYRALTFHRYSVFRQGCHPCRMIGVWRKEAER